jgi:hypothetical protein
MTRTPYQGPFTSGRAHRKWAKEKARREVPGVFARFAARRGWTRLQDGHHWTPAARRAEERAKIPTPGRPAPARTTSRAPSGARTARETRTTRERTRR